MTQPEAPLTTLALTPPFTASVSYERNNGRYLVVVEHATDPAKTDRRHLPTLNDPIHGIHRDDMHMIRSHAEEMCRLLAPPPPPRPKSPPPKPKRKLTPPAPPPDRARVTLWTPIDECGFSVRARNALVHSGYRIIGELVEQCRETWVPIAMVLRLPNCGRVSANEIMAVVEPLLSQLPVDDSEFIDWCRRNRVILETLRRNWYDFDDDERKDSTDETRHSA